jgi:hypothetical protein
MKYLNIITTATPRADIHNQCFIRYVKILLDSNPSYIIRLFVNLDKPPMMTEEEYEEAKQNIFLLENSSEKLQLFFSTNKENPSFKAAAKVLYTKCAEQIHDEDNNVFFWFEDDWILYDTEESPNITDKILHSVKSIERFFNDGRKILLLTGGSKYLNGRPHLFKRELFDVIISLYKRERLLDPEIVMMEAKKIVFEDKMLREHLTDKSVYMCIPLFTDVGIRWRKDRNIQKLNRFFYNNANINECDYTWEYYRETVLTIWRNTECLKSQKIKGICEEKGIKYEEKVVGVDCSINEVPRPSLGVLPYYSLYDLSIGSFNKCMSFLNEEINKRFVEDPK